jgi:hypothetical protein
MSRPFALLLTAACIAVGPASANVEMTSQPAARMELPIAPETIRTAETVKVQSVHKRKAFPKRAVRPKVGQEKWLNPQPEPPSPWLNPQPEPPMRR